jgi:hypothetical protein
MSDMGAEPRRRDTARVIVSGLLIAFAWILAPAVPFTVARLLPHAADCTQIGDVLAISALCAGAATVLVLRGFLHR